MIGDELRSDPYAFTFVRQHRRMHPKLVRARRRRRGSQIALGACVFAGLSLFGISFLSADPKAAVSVAELSDGAIEISVNPEAGSDQVLRELRAIMDGRSPAVDVATTSGPESIVGRIVGDGPGVAMSDLDPNLDYTASQVVVARDASGTIDVIVASDSRWDMYVADLVCSSFGRSVAEVRGELVGRGYSVAVTAVVDDAQNGSGAFVVRHAVRLADHVNLVVQPRTELTTEPIGCT